MRREEPLAPRRVVLPEGGLEISARHGFLADRRRDLLVAREGSDERRHGEPGVHRGRGDGRVAGHAVSWRRRATRAGSSRPHPAGRAGAWCRGPGGSASAPPRPPGPSRRSRTRRRAPAGVRRAWRTRGGPPRRTRRSSLDRDRAARTRRPRPWPGRTTTPPGPRTHRRRDAGGAAAPRTRTSGRPPRPEPGSNIHSSGRLRGGRAERGGRTTTVRTRRGHGAIRGILAPSSRSSPAARGVRSCAHLGPPTERGTMALRTPTRARRTSRSGTKAPCARPGARRSRPPTGCSRRRGACCSTTSTPRSPRLPSSWSSTAARAAPPARGTPSAPSSTRWSRCSRTRRCCVQSGKPVAVFRTHEDAPRVLLANSHLVPALGDPRRARPARGARPDDVRPDDGRIVDLHRHPGHPPGHLRDLRRLRSHALQRRPRGSPARLRRARRHGRRAAARRDHGRRDVPRRRRGRCPHRQAPRDGLPRPAHRRPRRGHRPAPSDAVPRGEADLDRRLRNIVDLLEAPGRAQTSRPSILTDQTSAHDPAQRLRARGALAREPPGAAPRTPEELRAPRAGHHEAPRRPDARPAGARRRRLRLRQQPPRRARPRAAHERVRHRGLRAGLHPPALLPRQGPLPLGRALGRSRRTSTARTSWCWSCSREDTYLANWIQLAREKIQFQGLPSRICWLGYGERAKFGLAINELVAHGRDLRPPS